MIGILIILACACLATCILEIVPLLFLHNRGKWIVASLLCNVITNPIVNLTIALLFALTENAILCLIATLLLEVGVVIIEMFLYHKLVGESLGKCLIISLLCNILSFGIGLFLTLSFYIADNQPPVKHDPFQPLN